jgi:hypothetical protein
LRWYLLVPGILIALAGLTFMLQGMGLVGPTSSFMYQSETWIVQGAIALVLGLVLMAAGILTGRKKA